MDKTKLNEILFKIKQQRIDERDSQNMLTTKKKETIYHEIIKDMMKGKTEYSLLKYGADHIFTDPSLQRQIRDWLSEEHCLECVRVFLDNDDLSNDKYYFKVIW